MPYDTKIDVWSVGAVLAELHTGYVLFQVHRGLGFSVLIIFFAF